jgi:flagellar hook-basal body complex protein FliE
VAIAAIGSAGAIANPLGISSIGGAGSAKAGSATAGVEGTKHFGNALTDALGNVEKAQSKADGLATDVATGKATDVHDYMIAATEASVMTELTVAVRNKAVESFNEIMRMGV